jgi:hypothetical protein
MAVAVLSLFFGVFGKFQRASIEAVDFAEGGIKST